MLHRVLLIFITCQICLIQSQNNTSQTLPPDVINLDRVQSRSSAPNTAPQFFSKFQLEDVHVITTVSDTFEKIPGLSLLFYHSQPRLYRIRIQGSICINQPGYVWVRILVDDQVPYANQLLPNNNLRNRAAASFGTSLLRLDARGGIFAGMNHGYHTYSCSKVDTLYIPGGVHSIDVGARIDAYAQIETFQLDVEVLELDEQSSTNLPLLTTR